jgi:hypothetical protein
MSIEKDVTQLRQWKRHVEANIGSVGVAGPLLPPAAFVASPVSSTQTSHLPPSPPVVPPQQEPALSFLPFHTSVSRVEPSPSGISRGNNSVRGGSRVPISLKSSLAAGVSAVDANISAGRGSQTRPISTAFGPFAGSMQTMSPRLSPSLSPILSNTPSMLSGAAPAAEASLGPIVFPGLALSGIVSGVGGTWGTVASSTGSFESRVARESSGELQRHVGSAHMPRLHSGSVQPYSQPAFAQPHLTQALAHAPGAPRSFGGLLIIDDAPTTPPSSPPPSDQ